MNQVREVPVCDTAAIGTLLSLARPVHLPVDLRMKHSRSCFWPCLTERSVQVYEGAIGIVTLATSGDHHTRTIASIARDV